MWPLLKTWAKARPLLAAIIAAVLIAVFSGVIDGISARRAATRYFDIVKGWQKAYVRDTMATKKAYEERIRILTADLNADETAWEGAKGEMARPWTPPKGATELEDRFRRAGFQGRVK